MDLITFEYDAVSTKSKIVLTASFLVVLIIDLFSANIQLSWILPLAIAYFSRNDRIVMYHSLQFFLIEVLKGLLLLIIPIISMFLDISYYTTEGKLGILAIIELVIYFLPLIYVLLELFFVFQNKFLQINIFEKTLAKLYATLS